MHKGLGRQNAALRGLAIIIIASALCAGAASAQRVALQENNPGNQSQQQETKADPQAAPRSAQEPTPRTPYEADCSRPADHDAADWCQQKRAADGAQRAAQAAVDALNVARNQSTLLWLTLAITAAALWAAFRAANAAHKTLEGLERPFILFYQTKILYGKRTRSNGKHGAEEVKWELLSVFFGYDFKNYGRAPCVIREVEIMVAQGERLPQHNSEWEPLGAIWPNWIMSEGREREKSATAELPINRWDFSLYKSGAHSIFIRGTMKYESVTGTVYERKFCYARMHGQSEFTSEYGGSEYNRDRVVRQRSRLERYIRNVVWVYIRHGFRHPAGPLPKDER